jgi:ribosomal protein S3
MGQKVHPFGFRLGFNRPWHSRWFSTKDYLKFLHEDLALRKELWWYPYSETVYKQTLKLMRWIFR